MELSASVLSVLDALLEARTGQRYRRNHEGRVRNALVKVVARHGFEDADALVTQLMGPGGRDLASEVVDAMVNNESYFFRDAATFRRIGDVLATLAQRRSKGSRLRIWSAGCSTGQEPYSLAMILADNRQRMNGADIDIVATDISGDAIARARAGFYRQFEIQRGLPVRQMLRYFSQGEHGWQLCETVRDMVRFRQHNVLEAAPAGYFDLILCRNVLFYFPPSTRSAVLGRLADALPPDGSLVLGAGEAILGLSDRLSMPEGSEGFYRLAERPGLRSAYG